MIRRNGWYKSIGKLPTIGILIFVVLYVYSSTLYPGGSQADLNTVYFDWVNNYWCNLMNEKGMNGIKNPARPIAISAMFILCISLMLFFIQFARKRISNKFWKLSVQIFGVLSMLCATLIFTKFHDLMTTLSSLLGSVVVIGIIWEVYKSNMTFFKITGVLCLMLLALNNYIYYTKHLIEYLPLLQKITFGIVLTWIMGLNIRITKENVLQHRIYDNAP